MAEPEKLDGDGIPRLFGAYNRDFLARHEGLSGVLLESRDAAADAAAFRDAGIAASEALRFEREAQRPDGTPIRARLLARLRARSGRRRGGVREPASIIFRRISGIRPSRRIATARPASPAS